MGAAAHTHCRICQSQLPAPLLDFGPMPLANAFLSSAEAFEDEPTFPLAVIRCEDCGLLQLDHVVPAEVLYRDYLYVSGTSEAAVRHATALADAYGPAGPQGVSRGELVVEIASNDGTVLAAFASAGARVLGVEPAHHIAARASARGIPTVPEFFNAALGAQLAAEHGKAALILARHVFAHVDDVRGFLMGARALLQHDGGSLLIEVPYLGRLYERLAFDTIYHEHLSYFALTPIARLCRQLDLRLIDVDIIDMHGGSLLMTIQHDSGQAPSERLSGMLEAEARDGLCGRQAFVRFAEQVQHWRGAFEALLARLDAEGARVVGYGAAAKANTILSWCREAARPVLAILDKSPLKQGHFTPGTHIPVKEPAAWRALKPTHMIIFAWNLEAEIRRQMAPYADAGGRFIVPIPTPVVLG